jgi:hypothetical protein
MRCIANSRRRRHTLAIVAIAFAFGSCRQNSAPAQTPPATTATPDAPASTKPHGDHNPHHGGIVMMKGDLHYEVVFDPTGHAHRLYFTDAVRDELPAAVASAVSLTIKRPKTAEEAIAMRIDDDGESWIGSGRPVDEPQQTSARVAFTIEHEPYWIDIPFATPAR